MTRGLRERPSPAKCAGIRRSQRGWGVEAEITEWRISVPTARLRQALEVPEDRMVPNRSRQTPQDSVAKFTHHEDLLGHVVLAAKGQTNRRKEAEAWVILRVPQYDHSGCVELPASLKALADKSLIRHLGAASMARPP